MHSRRRRNGENENKSKAILAEIDNQAANCVSIGGGGKASGKQISSTHMSREGCKASSQNEMAFDIAANLCRLGDLIMSCREK